MGMPSLGSMWDTTKNQVRRSLGRLPRPGRRGMALLLVLIAAGAFTAWKLPQLMPAPRPVQHLGGRPAPPEAPAKIPVEGQGGVGFRDDKLALATSSVENAAQPYLVGRASAPGEAVGAPWARRIIRRASLECELADVDRGITRLAEIIEAAGGYLADTQAHTDAKGTVRATITASVPPDQFGRAIAALEGIGRVTSRRIAGQDVSEEFVDLEARVRNLERHETQLLGFMGKAQKVADLLSLENELARVRGEIERLAGRIRFLKARTEMATIQIALVRTPLVTPPEDTLARWAEQVWVAFREGWQAAFRVATALTALAAQWSPMIVPALAAWVFYRRWARRRPALAPSAPAEPR